MLGVHYWLGDNVHNFGDELSVYLINKLSPNEQIKTLSERDKKQLDKDIFVIGSILSTRNLFFKSNIWGSGFLIANAKPISFALKAFIKKNFYKSNILALRARNLKSL